MSECLIHGLSSQASVGARCLTSDTMKLAAHTIIQYIITY